MAYPMFPRFLFFSFVGRLHAHRAFVDAIVFVPRIGLHRPRIMSGRFSKALDSELKKQGLDGDWGDCSGPEQTVHRYSSARALG